MNSIAYYIGYFIVLIICSIIACCVAKKHNPWGWFIAGAAVQLLALIGGEAEKAARGDTYSTLTDWIIYFFLLAVFAFIINNRRKSNHETNQENNSNSLL